MWLLYIKAEENDQQIIYHYSLESNDLDGEIIYDKGKKEFSVTKPCKKDAGSSWCIRRTEEHFWSIINEGFPNRRKVVTG